MYPPMICISCGNRLILYYDLYLMMKMQYIKEKYGFITDIESINFNNDYKIEMKEIFDRSKLKRMCCRMHLLTTRPLAEQGLV